MSTDLAADTLGYIMSTQAVRHRANQMFRLAIGGGTHFAVDEERLGVAADIVVAVVRERYPDLQVPYHSRWRHFTGDRNMLRDALDARLAGLDSDEVARARLDLIVVSVLLDAGAGGRWSYRVPAGDRVARSEGLALASLQMFLDGAFSLDGLLRVDARQLARFGSADIETGFQVSPGNPLLGVEGRAALLQKLGEALLARPDIFPTGRPGDLIDFWRGIHGAAVSATVVFETIVEAFGTIWPSRTTVSGRNLGDTWPYAPFGEGVDGLVPLHKLSQWMSYSIIETLEMSGFSVPGLDRLTGLAEYRNGGLFLDSGVLVLRNPDDARREHAPADPLIIEWRSLTVALLDRVAELVRERLGLSEKQFPLPCVLEGGTWLAGRKLAANLRSDGGSPLLIASDGTVF
jgi:hypothetical protein